jgi:competence protein ComEA
VRGESGRVAERVRTLLEEHSRAGVLDLREGGSSDGAAVGGAADGPRARHVDSAGKLGEARPVDGAAGVGVATVTVWGRLLAGLQARVPVRLDPGRRTALAVGVAAVLAAVLTGLWVLSARPKALAVSSAAPGLPGARSPQASAPMLPARRSTPAPASSSAAPVVVVDVAGKVRRPGVYRLPGGARVDDAIRAAGGALAGARLDRLNLAARLVDGQQVAVGIPPAAGGGGGPAVAGSGSPAPSGGASTAGPVDLNTAGLDQLETLPGVGPVLAQHILDWRTAHGSFASVDQLNDVSGIGEVKFAALRPLVSV